MTPVQSYRHLIAGVIYEDQLCLNNENSVRAKDSVSKLYLLSVQRDADALLSVLII